MTRTLTAIALTTIMASVSLPAFAMGPEVNMLTGKVYNELAARDIDTSHISDLSLGQLATIQNIVESDESEGNKTNRIKAVIANN